MAAFEEKYTDQQRDAIAHAYEDRRIRPARKVVQMAAAGELDYHGEILKPFEATENTVRDLARKLRRARAGETTSQLAHAEPRDAIETLRRRLVNAADAMLTDFERKTKRAPGDADPERLRQICRAVREAAAIPGPNDERPKAPGGKTDGRRNGGETKGGLAGSILAAHRASEDGQTEPAPDASPPHHAPGTDHPTSDHGEHDATPAAEHETEADDDGSPGSLVRELAARVNVPLL
jgi:hypothetical protein